MNNEMLVRDVMSKPVTIAKSAAITEALEKMLDEETDPLIVTNNGTVMGVISRESIAETLGSKHTSSLSPTKIHVANKTDEDFTFAYLDQNAEILIPLLQQYKIVVVYDSEHHLVGQVNAADLLRVIRPQTTIENLMQIAHTIRSDERVVHLRRRMLDEGVMKFAVVDNGEILGIVTETDMARSMKEFREIVEDKYQDHRIRNLLVRDVMSSPTIAVDLRTEISEVLDLILNKNISSLPVTRDGKLVGMITKKALIAAL